MPQIIIENLLRQAMGLDASTIGSSIITRAIERRMVEVNLPNMASYLEQLQASTEEMQALIESVIIPETWFFRDREPFNFLRKYVTSEWMPSQSKNKFTSPILRILSIPCSTGEEPYSIAIALLEAGLQPKSFHIDAVDISHYSLAKAKRAIYTKNSFRSSDLTFRDRYFETRADGYKLCESVANTVNFIQGNLLKDDFLSNKPAYDVIFCRNLLIYFDDSTKKQAIKTLNRLLTEQGLLFVGHSETRQILASGFVGVRHPLAFAHRKAEKPEPLGILPIPTLTTYTPLKIPAPSLNHTLFPTNNRQPSLNHNFFPANNRQPSLSPSLNNQQSATAIRLQAKEQQSLLQNAKDLADQGQLNEAVKLCEAYLMQDPLSAEAYLLCGQVYQAMGNQEEAEKHFQKAVYLDPNHYDALFHLALIKEHQGELKQAEIIRQRVQRINHS